MRLRAPTNQAFRVDRQRKHGLSVTDRSRCSPGSRSRGALCWRPRCFRCCFGRRSTKARLVAPMVAAAVRPGASSHTGLFSLPLAAQGPVSEALGADGKAWVSASKGGCGGEPRAASRPALWPLGGTLRSGATHVGLSLRAMGYETSLGALGQVTPRKKANRVLYERASLSEWVCESVRSALSRASRSQGRHRAPGRRADALDGTLRQRTCLACLRRHRPQPRGGPSLGYGGLQRHRRKWARTARLRFRSMQDGCSCVSMCAARATRCGSTRLSSRVKSSLAAAQPRKATSA